MFVSSRSAVVFVAATIVIVLGLVMVPGNAELVTTTTATASENNINENNHGKHHGRQQQRKLNLNNNKNHNNKNKNNKNKNKNNNNNENPRMGPMQYFQQQQEEEEMGETRFDAAGTGENGAERNQGGGPPLTTTTTTTTSDNIHVAGMEFTKTIEKCSSSNNNNNGNNVNNDMGNIIVATIGHSNLGFTISKEDDDLDGDGGMEQEFSSDRNLHYVSMCADLDTKCMEFQFYDASETGFFGGTGIIYYVSGGKMVELFSVKNGIVHCGDKVMCGDSDDDDDGDEALQITGDSYPFGVGKYSHWAATLPCFV